MSNGIIDGHQHFWQVGRFDYPWMSREVEVLYRDYLPATLEPILKRCGVTETILVQASNSLAETRWLLSLAETHTFIAGVVGWVDLMSSEVRLQLDEFTKHPQFKGVRHLVESESADDWLIQDSVIAGLRALASYGVSYDLLVHPRHLRYVRTVAAKCPELHLVIDHMAKPPIARGELNEWAKEIGEVARYPNISCKLSGLVTEADLAHWRPADLKPFVQTALECFGPRRMIFGSDYPVCLRAASYDQVLDSFQALLADLSDEEQGRIFAGNAIEFYGIQQQAQAA